MYESPRDRRLKTDFQALQRLKSVSSIMDFETFGNPPQRYLITFNGKGLCYNQDTNEVDYLLKHQVEIRLGASYPRNKPDLKWKSSIFHPNISALGQVCLGGYGTNWVPSLNLDELCEMLWDMIRFANFDTKSPYNYKAARWVERQNIYRLPLDGRSLRDQTSREVIKSQEESKSAGTSSAASPDIENVKIPEVKKPSPIRKPPEEIVFISDDSEFEDTDNSNDGTVAELFFIGDD